MNFTKISGRNIAFLLVSISILFSTSDILANLNGRWIQHPAACLRSDNKESHVYSILEGERYIYFCVRGFYMDRNDSYYYNVANDIDAVQIFRYDKTLPWTSDNIRPLAKDVELSGSFPVVMNYDPGKGVFAVVSENNNIDFIFDDGTVISSKALRNVSVPLKNAKPYSITFDSQNPTAYVAGSFGYSTIDYTNGELVNHHSFDKEVAWAVRVGDKMVLLAGEVSPKSYAAETYVFPVSDVPKSLGTPVSGASNLQYLMPLGESTFAAMAPGSSDLQYNLKVFTTEGGVTGEVVAANCNVDNGAAARFRHLFRTDGFAAPGKIGFAIQNNDNILSLKKGIEFIPSEGIETYKANALTVVSKNGLTANEKNSKASLYDGNRLWLYTYETAGTTDTNPRGFYFRTLADGTWSEKSDVGEINAPTSTFAAYSVWDPDLGLIIRGPGAYFTYDASGNDMISSYKDGKWKDLSYAANYSQYNYNVVTLAANHISIDPLNKNWIWGVSPLRGVHRMDLGNYANHFELCNTGSRGVSYQNTYPGCKAYFESQSVYPTLVNFSNMDFDNNGVMWMVKKRYYEGDSEDDITRSWAMYTPIYYFTPEERNNFRQDMPASDIPMHEIRVKGAFPDHWGVMIAMKAPGNENYLAYSCRWYPSDGPAFFIYDHNGTLDDTSDDRQAFAEGFYDENGDAVPVSWEKGIYEDEKIGDLWFFTGSGPILMNPSDILSGNKKVRRLNITKKDGMDVNENPLEHVAVNYICADKFGRKWLSTEMGLYCLSADNSELLGHYTVENSPLPSDEIVSVACDLNSGSVFALTTRGMVEFQPEESLASIPEGSHLNIWPSSLTPDYKGYVNITGAENSSVYKVYNKEGNEVKSLGTPKNGLLQWDATNNEGLKVGVGSYDIRREGKNESHRVIVL